MHYIFMEMHYASIRLSAIGVILFLFIIIITKLTSSGGTHD
jgi:hypothetical protein